MESPAAKVDLRSYEGDPALVIAERELILRTNGFNEANVTTLFEFRPSLFDTVTSERVINFLRDEVDIDPVAAVMDYPGLLSLGVEGLQNKFAELEGIGFSEPRRLFREMPRVVRFAADTISSKIESLRQLGFTRPTRIIEGNPRVISFGVENIEQKLSDLAALGVENVVDFCENCPDILSYGAESLLERIVEIESVGLDAIPAINKHPKLFMCSKERLVGTIEYLTEIGVKDALKLLQRFPKIINYSQDSVRAKIDELAALGVMQPVRLIEKAPFVLSNSSEAFRAKIDCLAGCGFTVPAAVVEKNPSLLARSEGAIQKRVRLIERLIKHYKLDYSARDLLEENPVLFNPSDNRLLMMVRIAATLVSQTGEKIQARDAVRAAFLNVEAAIIALAKITAQTPAYATIGEWIQESKKVQSQMPSKDRKTEFIMGSLAVDPKIKRIYRQKFVTDQT